MTEHQIATAVLMGIAALGLLYLTMMTIVVALKGRPRRAPAPAALPPISVLKPLCGDEPHLYDNLKSYCLQDYPNFQVVFGVREAGDPAIAVVRRLIADLPERDLTLVIDGRVIGRNYKVSNLANMIGVAKHGLIVMADSDTRVAPDYLRAIATAFEPKTVGAVTCLYRGTVGEGRASSLGAVYLNDWYMASVVLASTIGGLRPCFGQTMAIRRDLLDKVGGLDALKDHVADDFMLGELVKQGGHEVAIAPTMIDNVVCEPDLVTLFRHELRWARTLRAVRPFLYPLTLITDALPLSLLAFLASGLAAEAGLLFLAAGILRVLHHSVVSWRFGGDAPYRPWLIPYRDLITMAVRLASLGGKGILWRGHRFTLKPSGQMMALD